MKMKSILLTALTLLLLSGCGGVRDIYGNYYPSQEAFKKALQERKAKEQREEQRKAEYYKTPEGKIALKQQQEARQRAIDTYGCKARNTLTHNYVEIDRVATKTWYDPAGKKYRHFYTTYLQCRDCGRRGTGSTGD